MEKNKRRKEKIAKRSREGLKAVGNAWKIDHRVTIKRNQEGK